MPEEIVVAILAEFFVKSEDNGWHHARAQREIENFKSVSEAGRRGAEARWGKNAIAMPPQCDRNATPLATNNQEPITNNIPIIPKMVEDEEEVVVKGRNWSAEFDSFWSDYPETRKKNRYRVESAWSAVRHHLPPINELQAALRAFKASPEWRRDAGKFIPSPESWLTERRWQDAPAYSPPAKAKPKSSVDEADAFSWRSENYPDSLEIHPSPNTLPFSAWPGSTRREYLASKKQPQLQTA